MCTRPSVRRAQGSGNDMRDGYMKQEQTHARGALPGEAHLTAPNLSAKQAHASNCPSSLRERA
eukprot:1485975-Heterocapsa_arctica.AAC.2